MLIIWLWQYTLCSQEALKKATEDLQETQRILGEAKDRLREVEEGIASLQAKYDECIAKKEELEYKTELCTARLTRAEKVGLHANEEMIMSSAKHNCLIFGVKLEN